MSGGDKQIASVSYWLVKVKQCEQGGWGWGGGGFGRGRRRSERRKNSPPPPFSLPLSLTTKQRRMRGRRRGRRRRGEVAFLRNLQPPKSCSDGNHTAQTTDTRLHGEGLACCSRLDWFDLAPQDLIKLRPKPPRSFSIHIVNVKSFEKWPRAIKPAYVCFYEHTSQW